MRLFSRMGGRAGVLGKGLLHGALGEVGSVFIAGSRLSTRESGVRASIASGLGWLIPHNERSRLPLTIVR